MSETEGQGIVETVDEPEPEADDIDTEEAESPKNDPVETDEDPKT